MASAWKHIDMAELYLSLRRGPQYEENYPLPPSMKPPRKDTRNHKREKCLDSTPISEIGDHHRDNCHDPSGASAMECSDDQNRVQSVPDGRNMTTSEADAQLPNLDSKESFSHIPWTESHPKLQKPHSWMFENYKKQAAYEIFENLTEESFAIARNMMYLGCGQPGSLPIRKFESVTKKVDKESTTDQQPPQRCISTQPNLKKKDFLGETGSFVPWVLWFQSIWRDKLQGLYFDPPAPVQLAQAFSIKYQELLLRVVAVLGLYGGRVCQNTMTNVREDQLFTSGFIEGFAIISLQPSFDHKTTSGIQLSINHLPPAFCDIFFYFLTYIRPFAKHMHSLLYPETKDEMMELFACGNSEFQTVRSTRVNLLIKRQLSRCPFYAHVADPLIKFKHDLLSVFVCGAWGFMSLEEKKVILVNGRIDTQRHGGYAPKELLKYRSGRYKALCRKMNQEYHLQLALY